MTIFLSTLTFLFQEKHTTAVVSQSALCHPHILAMALRCLTALHRQRRRLIEAEYLSGKPGTGPAAALVYLNSQETFAALKFKQLFSGLKGL